MVMTHPSPSPQPGIEGQSGKNMCQGGKPNTGKFHSSYIGICGSAYENGCGRWHVCYGSGLSIIYISFQMRCYIICAMVDSQLASQEELAILLAYMRPMKCALTKNANNIM